MKTKLITQSVFLGICVSSFRALGAEKDAAIRTVNTVWAMYKSRTSTSYHDKDHILFVATWILNNVVRTPDISHPILYVAALYHDAKKTEEASAELAVRDLSLLGVSDKDIKLTSQCILDTTHAHKPQTKTGACLADADLASFSGDIEDVWADTNRLWKESGKSADGYVKTNTAFLRPILERSRIYNSGFMRTYENVARTNIAEVLERLGSGLLGELVHAIV